VYRDDRNPREFAGVLKKLWNEGDDAVYSVPQRSGSLARVVNRPDLVLRTPVNGIDVEPLVPYVKAIGDPALPEDDFRWVSRHSAVIRANLSRRQVVSVQISYHPGWQSSEQRRGETCDADGLGQMYVEPDCEGVCTIELTYDGGREIRIARSVATISGILACVVLAMSFRR
jgi:hypothetical protein